MTRSRTLFFPDGRRIDVDPNYAQPARPRVAIHGVKTPFRSHADGRWYDDSRTYEREVRARGFEIVGNERKPFFEREPVPMPPLRDDIERAEAMVARGEPAEPDTIPDIDGEWDL